MKLNEPIKYAIIVITLCLLAWSVNHIANLIINIIKRG